MGCADPVALPAPDRPAASIAPDEQALGLNGLLKLAASVPEEIFEAVVCRFYDEMELDEIARHTGVSRRTVSERLRRARDEIVQLQGGTP